MTHLTSELHSEQFTSQIDELFHLLDAFSQVLDDESDCIKHNQSEKLIEVATQKNDIASQLSSTTNTLETLLKPLNLNIATLNQSEVFKTLSSDIQSKVNDLIPKIEVCVDKNLANGMSIQILSNINQHALDLLSGKQQDVKLYGSTGEKTPTANKQSNLGKA